MKVLDLFSGIGGFSYGLEKLGFKTVAFCEIDKFCKLLLQKHWKGVKIYDDVKEITKQRLETDGVELPDVITGGFPCQPFSVAGKQRGTDDNRHLWPQMFRIIRELAPRWVVGENVRGLVNIQDGMVFETVCTDLEGEGYEVRAFNIPAAGVGAPHRRERIWIIANKKESMVNSNKIRFQQHNETEEETSRRRSGTTFKSTGDVVNTEHNGSSTSTIEGSSTASSDNNQEGQNETSEFKRTSRPSNSEAMANAKSQGTRKDEPRLWERIKRTSGRKRTDQNVEDTRRTLRPRSLFKETNENETRKRNANINQRSSSPSESDVAHSKSLQGNGRGRHDYPSTEQGPQQAGGTSGSMANTYGGRGTQPSNEIQAGWNQSGYGGEDVADANETGLQGFRTEHQLRESQSEESTGRIGWWESEPDVGRVAHGVSGRVHRLKALGNAIVPQIAEEIGRAILAAEGAE